MSLAEDDQPPACLPPRDVRPPTTFELPRGAWDTHAHVIGGGPEMPFVAERQYTPQAADSEAFVAMMDKVGLDFGVAIQISVHGADNRLILEGLSRHPERLRGVVSINGAESESELEAMRKLGVCGIRLNEHFAGGVGGDQLLSLSKRCRPLGWHVDLGLPAGRLRELNPQLHALDMTFVIDHMALPVLQHGVEHPDFVSILELARLDNCWVKLSGAYRVSSRSAPYDDAAPFVRALCEAAPDRTIWGSDWPNVAMFEPATAPETGEQLDALISHVGDPRQLHAILVDNPLRLYGKPGSPVRAAA